MRLGTRGSALALAQAELVSRLLGGAEVIPMATSGDRGAGPQDKSRWVLELEQALGDGEIDLAVHSAKDVPGALRDGLALLGAPPRASVEDALCGASGLERLSPGARVGTGSPRRIAQLRAAREDIEVVALRGNVDTRLRKLADPAGRLDAIVLARAGLERLGRDGEAGGTLPLQRFAPAPGQGTIVLEGRSEDERAREAIAAINDEDTFACLLAERALARELGADCHTPLGACAVPGGCGCLHMHAWVGLPDGSQWCSDELLGGFYDPEALGRRVAERLAAVGAREILSRAHEMALAAGDA